ncbi:MAG: MoxR family ATPase [Bacillota bacterium]
MKRQVLTGDEQALQPQVGSQPLLETIHQRMHAVEAEVKKVVVGVDRAVRLTTLALFARGHVLLHGLPGQGKTLMATCFARAIGGVSERFQGSPDFLFSEALVSAFPDERGELKYYAGRLLRHGERLGIVLLDEINRFMPNTQAGFLEVMQERKVTTATRTFPIPHFLGIATRNPLEAAETYPLPEALLDRFLMLIRMEYPDPQAELRIMTDPAYRRMEAAAALVQPVVHLEELNVYAEAIGASVRVSEAAARYIHRLAMATRKPSAFGVRLNGTGNADEHIIAGVSTRGMVHLRTAAQVAALHAGREYVTPQDIHDVVFEVFEHRIFVKPVVLTQHPEFVRTLLREVLRRVCAP